MRLDKNLTSQQLWTIATDREHRTADLLDQIVDHPATYRALSDWAVAALGEQDVRAVDAPPAPDADAAEPRRGLRLPTMPLGRRAAKPPAPEPEVEPPASEPEVEPPASEPEVEPPAPEPEVEPPASEPEVEPPAPEPEASGIDAWLSADPIVEPAPEQRATQRVRVTCPDRSGQADQAQHEPTSWLRRPAPISLVIVLVVVEVFTLLALAVVGRQEPVAPATPVVTSSSTATVTKGATVEASPTATATKGEKK